MSRSDSSSGFIEPLESTSIHLMMVGVTRLLHLFPFGGINSVADRPVQRSAHASRWRRRATSSCCTTTRPQRDDTPFWRHCREMPIPDSLAQRIELFQADRLCVSGRQRTVPRRFVDPGDVGAAHHARNLSSRGATAGRPKSSRNFSPTFALDSADRRAHAGSSGFRESVLQGEQQRLELKARSSSMTSHITRISRVQKLTIGREQAPLLVIDNLRRRCR